MAEPTSPGPLQHARPAVRGGVGSDGEEQCSRGVQAQQRHGHYRWSDTALGDVTLTFHLTPGHSPGEVSTLISPLKDGTRRHVGSIFSGRGWGGPQLTNGIPYYATELEGMKTWGASARRYKTLAESAGADVFLAKHDTWTTHWTRLNAVRFRKPGDPHPFVSKTAVGRYQTIISECMDAQLAWRSGQ